VDLPGKRLRLGTKQLLVEGNQHRTFQAKDAFLATIRPHGRQLGSIQTPHGLARNGQQIGVLGGNQRTDKVQSTMVHKFEVLGRVVALVEDQGDLTNLLRERAAAFEQLLGHTVKGHGIGLIAGVGVMKQRDFAIGGDQNGQPQEAKVVVPLFAMAALRQLGTQVETVQEGKEVGGVKQQTAQIQAETGNGGVGQILFDGGHLFATDPLHVVPKTLTGQLCGGEGQQAAQRGFAVPAGDSCFAGGGETTVESRQQKIVADGRTLVAPFGDVAVNGRDHVQSLGDREDRSRPAKFLKGDFSGLRT
jgi:hypothetical protein